MRTIILKVFYKSNDPFSIIWIFLLPTRSFLFPFVWFWNVFVRLEEASIFPTWSKVATLNRSSISSKLIRTLSFSLAISKFVQTLFFPATLVGGILCHWNRRSFDFGVGKVGWTRASNVWKVGADGKRGVRIGGGGGGGAGGGSDGGSTRGHPGDGTTYPEDIISKFHGTFLGWSD